MRANRYDSPIPEDAIMTTHTSLSITLVSSLSAALLVSGCMAQKAPRATGHARAQQVHEKRAAGAPRAERDDAPRERDRSREQYEHHGFNEFKDPSDDALSTFAADVDTGSYTISRRKLNSGQMPPPASVRVEEFVNYFGYDYPEPESGPFAVHTEAAPSPFASKKDRYLMRVGVQGKEISRAERKPVHLTFLVDVSGSMSSRDKLGLAKESLKLLTRQLKEGDTVALATYAGRTAKILEPTGVAHRERILSALDRLKAGGSTAMNSGLQLAYNMAMESFHPEHVNRVVVVSDGDANVGPDSHGAILETIQRYVDKGVRLSTIGFGTGNYRDTMMEQLANNGNGNYFYIDGMDEARRIFAKQINGTLQIIAKDVKLQVEFHDEAVERYRLIGYENRNVKDENFRNESVDAGEIGAGHTVTALYEVEVDARTTRPLATVRVRHKTPRGEEGHEQSFPYRTDQLHRSLDEAPRDFQFAAAVGGFAELLRHSPYAKNLSYELVEEVAASSTEGKETREEFVDLVRKAKRLSDDGWRQEERAAR